LSQIRASMQSSSVRVAGLVTKPARSWKWLCPRRRPGTFLLQATKKEAPDQARGNARSSSTPTESPGTLFTAIKASSCAAILTPHGGEFARLFPDIAEKLATPATTGPAYSKVDATREAAARSGATVVFKGADTVIAKPEGQCSIAAAVYERAAPWLATAGSGDVLAGMIAGLAARGVSDPAASAAWLHQDRQISKQRHRYRGCTRMKSRACSRCFAVQDHLSLRRNA